jgi:Tol biopolymer transport system component
VAFVSRREGLSRIWLKQIRGDGEMALTDGPADSEPRFFPDGQSILFTRADEKAGTSLWRVPVVGGQPRKLVEAAHFGDVSPDGDRIVFLRNLRPGDGSSALVVVPVSGGAERELARFDTIVYSPRFSPDGRTVALSEEGSAQSGIPGATVLVNLDGRVRRIPSTVKARKSTSVAWVGTGAKLLVGFPDASIPHARSAGLLVNEVDLSSGATAAVAWWSGAGRTLDLLDEGKVVFDSVSTRESLREVPIGSVGPTRSLTNGLATDRQPVYSPDGRTVLFSSDRSGQLDLWLLSRETGALHRVTDDAAQDWDPAFSPDGSRILWSTNRSGNFEVWTAEADGTGARPLTTGGVDAENPVLTPDGATLLYGSLHRGKEGIWRAGADGSRPELLVRGAMLQLPEVSPDGRYVLFRDGFGTGRRAVRVVKLPDAAPVFEIAFDVTDGMVGVEAGRARWMPDGRSIAFLGVDERGVPGVFVQDFVPGRDTTTSRRPLAGFDPGAPAESFGIAPDGKHVTLAARQSLSSVFVAESVPGAERPRRP